MKAIEFGQRIPKKERTPYYTPLLKSGVFVYSADPLRTADYKAGQIPDGQVVMVHPEFKRGHRHQVCKVLEIRETDDKGRVRRLGYSEAGAVGLLPNSKVYVQTKDLGKKRIAHPKLNL